MPETLSVSDLVRPCVFYSGPMDVLHSLIGGNMSATSKHLQLHDSLITATRRSTACACWESSLCGAVLQAVAVCEQRCGKHQVLYLLMFDGSQSEVFHMYLGTGQPVDQQQQQQPQHEHQNIWTILLCTALMEAHPIAGLVAVSLRSICNKQRNSMVSCQHVA
ncbi:uncharacterized protein DMAD_01778 [Drosophila madeirensis]|uniref:Uncharacterized protein n=1 Tax=Drosophila madeirensis TaxID=30013 RepID=A0AAU9G157_DROMD